MDVHDHSLRMSLPKFYIDTPDPTPSTSTSSFSCKICTSFQPTFIDHNTPDCRHYICFICETPQPSHLPENCPECPTTPANLVNWRVFNPTKGIMLWLAPFVFVTTRLSFSFSFFSLLFDYGYMHDTRGLLLILTHTHTQTIYMRTDHQHTV